MAATPLAVVGDRLCTDLLDVTSDLSALDGEGFWAVVVPYAGDAVCARFATIRPARPWTGARWHGPARDAWTSSLDADAFGHGVRSIREAIAAGDVYQVNLTRVASAPLGDPEDPHHDIAALGAALAKGNPAPYSAVVRLPTHGVAVASASPERYLRRDGDAVASSPIKGTAATRDGFSPKDRAENVMIVDLVRNDLGRVCEYGSVRVPELLAVEAHPGLHHLVSTVTGTLRPDVGWPELIDATFPPGSVTGAPKVAACSMIDRLEPVPRGPYCGAIGWVDADRRQGELNVAIRTFWIDGDRLCFGTGGGITWDSTPEGEWAETELKAKRLLAVTSEQPLGGAGRSMSTVWLDGALVDSAEAHVAYDDHGLTVGDGAFETLKVVGGRPFALTRHLDRLARSLAALALPAVDLAELRAATEAVCAAHGTDGFVRVTVTGGRGPLGSPRGDATPTRLVAIRPGAVREVPCDVHVVDEPRNERGLLAGVKSTSYAENVVALARAQAVGADEAIFGDTQGRLSEGTGSNVFLVVDGRLVTPSLATGCLAGVTRSLLLELLGDAVAEAEVPVGALAEAPEAFLASTGREVQAIRAVDGRLLPAAPGPHTRAARAAWVAAYGRPDSPLDP